MTPAETLRKAKAVLLERGWYQGDWCDKDKRCVCALGAISLAVNQDEPDALALWAYEEIAAYSKARRSLQAAVGVDYIDDWNDAKERTFPEVLAGFDKAIALAEGTQR